MSSDLQYGACAVHILYQQLLTGWNCAVHILYQAPALKVLEDRKNKFQAMEVSIFKPDHCSRKITPPLRFYRNTCVPTSMH